jgi:hypothetical protein
MPIQNVYTQREVDENLTDRGSGLCHPGPPNGFPTIVPRSPGIMNKLPNIIMWGLDVAEMTVRRGYLYLTYLTYDSGLHTTMADIYRVHCLHILVRCVPCEQLASLFDIRCPNLIP